MRASKNGRQVLIGRINLRLWYLNERVSGFSLLPYFEIFQAEYLSAIGILSRVTIGEN